MNEVFERQTKDRFHKRSTDAKRQEPPDKGRVLRQDQPTTRTINEKQQEPVLEGMVPHIATRQDPT